MPSSRQIEKTVTLRLGPLDQPLDDGEPVVVDESAGAFAPERATPGAGNGIFWATW